MRAWPREAGLIQIGDRKQFQEKRKPVFRPELL